MRRSITVSARHLLVVLAIAIASITATGNAAPPICEVGEPNCMPTPTECASGDYNGVWPGGEPDRVALCLALAGHTITYVGGDVGTLCGTVGIADTYVFPHPDPNRCPPTGTPPGHGVPGSRFQEAARGHGGALASQSPAATEVGAAILATGGNAVDAAVATVFAIGVTRPDLCGIGGRGVLLYRSAAGEVAALDFQATAPAAVTPGTMDGFGIHSSGVGRRVLGVPGVVAGMDEALRRYGTVSLADAIGPAERLARNGIIVSTELAAAYQDQPRTVPGTPIPSFFERTWRLRLFGASAAVYLKNGVLPYQPGDRLVQTDYADSLALIATEGPDAFYRGAITDKIIDAMDDPSPYPGNEGLLTTEDFDAYRPIWRDPIVSSYRGAEIVGAPPPASSLRVVEALNILEGFDLAAAGHSSADHFHLAAEAEKIAFADADAYLTDPDFVDVPTETLASKEYADARRTEIEPDTAKDYAPGDVGVESAARSAPSREQHTTHVSVVDAAGNAVSVTCSLGDLFGSAWLAPGAGFLFADVVSVFSDPGTRDEAHGGKRPAVSHAPVIVAQDGLPIFVAGGGGGLRIPMAVTLAVSNVVDFSFDVARAVDAARIDEIICCSMTIEDGRVLPEVLEELIGRGHELVRVGEYDGVPWVQIAGWDLATGAQLAAFDPRGDGRAHAQ